MSPVTASAVASLALVIVLATACAHGAAAPATPPAARPGWLSCATRHADVAGQQLCAVDAAPESVTAAARSRQQLASIVELVMSKVTRDTSDCFTTDCLEELKAYDGAVERLTGRVLADIVVTDEWRDPEAGRTFALATLSLAQIRARFEEADSVLQEQARLSFSRALEVVFRDISRAEDEK